MKRSTMMAWLARAILLLCVLLLPANTALAAVESKVTRTTGTYEQSIYVPCANGGQGETIVISGKYRQVVQRLTDTEDPNFLVTHISISLVGVKGVGQTTGTVFKVTGGRRYSYVTPQLPLVLKDRFTVRMKAPGNGGHYTYQQNFQTVINKNRTAVFKEGETIRCK